MKILVEQIGMLGRTKITRWTLDSRQRSLKNPYRNVFESLSVGICHPTNVILATSVLVVALGIQNTGGLAFLVEVKVKEDLEVCVEHHGHAAVGHLSLPLPMWLGVIRHTFSGILEEKRYPSELENPKKLLASANFIGPLEVLGGHVLVIGHVEDILFEWSP